ncbi:DUF1826 domain-containing protein [Acinetobacter sp. ACIN00229]|uniref:DUF1826 domain-containing protein n=1 Tax=Acinetobacter sp. ACIN00229 TaxID=2792607 RepID=UPI0018E05B94|nr:DUF1826 domain-containing protein [Acinetobacter sp. ACIN00229]MBI0421299.1 DUF1826 domain-containing protein [Acinetobacter sp. ACIN00229]
MLSKEDYSRFLNSDLNYKIFESPKFLCSQECYDLTYALPHDFVFHFLHRDFTEFEKLLSDKLISSLSKEICEGAIIRIVDELKYILSNFVLLTGNKRPIASLRVVTPEYLEKEKPSVSQYYHRDSTALTITKVYFGEGAIYVDNNNVRREYFSKNSIQKPNIKDIEILYDPLKIHTVPDGGVLLLKGEVYEDIDSRSRQLIDMFVSVDEIPDFNRNNGLIHKGGGFVMGSRRLVFTSSTYL